MPVLPAHYAWWQDSLARAFLADRANLPVVLFVDDNELRVIAPHEGQHASAALARAVRELVDTSNGSATFRRVHDATVRWERRRETGPPPCLPLLALTVLAASRMRPGPNVRASNYFLRLAETLYPERMGRALVDVRDTLKGGAFDDVADMWRRLARWIDAAGGERGISTIRARRPLARIGYPLSQALVRHNDRSTLTRFFSDAGLTPGESTDGSSLAEWLAVWRGHPDLGKTLRDALANSEVRPLLEDILAEIAARWDGNIVTSGGKRRLEVRLAVDPDRWEVRWAFPASPGIDRDALEGTIDNQSVCLNLLREGNYQIYQDENSPPVTGAALTQRFALEGTSCTAFFSPMPVRPFIEDPDVGGWLSVRSFRPYEEHLVLAIPTHEHTLIDILGVAAEQGWRKVRRPLLGHIVFERVVFRESGKLTAAVLSVSPELKMVAAPETPPRPRLTNGLRLESGLASNVYLAGGEPDLHLPASPEPRSAQAALDGVAQVPPFHVGPVRFPIPLRHSGPYRSGRHELEVDGVKLEFFVRDAAPGLSRGIDRHSIGWDVHGELARKAIAVSGARAPGQKEVEPYFARRGKDETWIINRDGTFEPQREPKRLEWVATRLPGVTSLYFPIWPSSKGAWLAQRSGLRWVVSPLDPHPHKPAAKLDDLSSALWESLDGHWVEHRAWYSYVKAAREARGV